MEFLSIFLIAVALAMDSFSVSLTKGFTQKDMNASQMICYGLLFGAFHVLMPVLGYYAGETITAFVTSVAPWIAFILLLIVGLDMIKDSIHADDDKLRDEFSIKEVIILAIATSIDAFAVGITFALLNTYILIPSIVIGSVVCLFTISGILIGRKLGDYFGDKFLILGGVILILIGIKILLGF